VNIPAESFLLMNLCPLGKKSLALVPFNTFFPFLAVCTIVISLTSK